MLTEVDSTLERWLRQAVPLPADAVEVSFEQPQPAWDQGRAKPLVNLFLHALDKSTSGTTSGSRIIRDDDGGPLSRVESVPVVAATYLISVWGGGASSEHELLGRLVSLLADATGIPDAFQSDALRRARPGLTMALLGSSENPTAPIWAGLGIPPRPAVQIVVNSPMTLPVEQTVAPAPSSLRLGVSPTGGGAAYAPRRRRLGTSMVERVEAKKSLETSIQDSAREQPTVVQGEPQSRGHGDG